MELRERLRRGLEVSRGFTERLLEDFQSTEAWITPAVEGMNHALWIAGHLSVADDAFAGMMDASAGDPRKDYRRQFGKGSQPVFDAAQYDEPEQVLSYMRQRRTALLGVLEQLPEADFTKQTPDKAPPFMYDYAAVFQMAAWHESLHTGQLTAIRRKLGHGPVV